MNTTATQDTLPSAYPQGTQRTDRTRPRVTSSGAAVIQRIRRLLNVQALTHLILIRPVIHILFRVRIEGANRMTKLKRFMLVANHNSHLDAPLLFMALPVSQITKTRPVAAVDYFSRHPVLFALANFLFRPIWIDRDTPGEVAIEYCLKVLDGGDNIILFPEGTRGLPGEIGRFKSGVGRVLQHRPGIQIVPAFLKGTERSLPRGARIPKFISHRVIVGSPCLVKGSPNDVALWLRSKVEALSHQMTLPVDREASPARHQPLRIAVTGIDECGTSTLSRQLARELSGSSHTCLVSDKLEFYERGHRMTR